MAKKTLLPHYITLTLFCQVFCAFLLLFTPFLSVNHVAATPSDAQLSAISTYCSQIKESLREIQRRDSRARVYLGRYYEIILNRFITPLNLRIVENNLSVATLGETRAALLENQTGFANSRTKFISDYISYQQSLEDLVAEDCKANPPVFYAKLETVRKKRSVVNEDTKNLRTLAASQVTLVNELEEKL